MDDKDIERRANRIRRGWTESEIVGNAEGLRGTTRSSTEVAKPAPPSLSSVEVGSTATGKAFATIKLYWDLADAAPDDMSALAVRTLKATLRRLEEEVA